MIFNREICVPGWIFFLSCIKNYILRPRKTSKRKRAEQNSNQTDTAGITAGGRQMGMFTNSAEMDEKINLIMKFNGIDWWELDVPENKLSCSLINKFQFDFDTGPDGRITLKQYVEKIHKDDLASVKLALDDCLKGHTEYIDIEYRIVDISGREIWVHDRGMAATRDSGGKPLKIIGLVEDISNHKQIQFELLESKHKAEEADRLKTAFLTNMSHEIRTPMNAIIGFSELLADPGINKEDIASYTKIIKNRSSHLLQIVNDILDISRIEANQVELKESPLILNQLLDDLYLFYAQKLIDDKKFRILLNIEKSLDDSNSVICIDELRLRQVLGNLLDNAVKFTHEGSIEFGYRLIADEFVFHVSDTGIGIPEEKHEVIFERFRQVDASLARQYGGNGLGLAICKAFVELMGGKIWLESNQGSGTTFYFSIRSGKVQNIKSDSKTRHSGLTGFRWAGKRILLVEDDVHSAAFMHELFCLTGVDLITAYTAKEALKLFGTSPDFDLVLMDIQLPDKSGIELTRQMKKIDTKIPVIAQTAFAMPGDNIKCLQAGCDDYISKPVNISELFSKINNILYR
jgi:signal transduction histidine kinase